MVGWFNTISNNIVCNNGQSGINIEDSENNLISNNVISENVVNGVEIYKSDFNVIQLNTITQNLIDGIALNYYSYYNVVIDNYVYENMDDGVQISKSSNNSFRKNQIIENNETGIQITDYSFYNKLYHNNIINNTVNAVDECGGIWNESYPLGGNYWSDYNEDDLYGGPNQDMLGPDGIGDIPYEIPCEHGTDYYPLMNPFEIYYIMDIESPEEVNEGEMFDVVVKSVGWTFIPIAKVKFNDEIKLTDSEGRVSFTAPQVDDDTFFDIDVYKEGYTGDTESILVKNLGNDFETMFIVGLIRNLTTEGEFVTFEALNVRVASFLPFQFNAYFSGEEIVVRTKYIGFIGLMFIFTLCDAYVLR